MSISCHKYFDLKMILQVCSFTTRIRHRRNFLFGYHFFVVIVRALILIWNTSTEQFENRIGIRIQAKILDPTGSKQPRLSLAPSNHTVVSHYMVRIYVCVLFFWTWRRTHIIVERNNEESTDKAGIKRRADEERTFINRFQPFCTFQSTTDRVPGPFAGSGLAQEIIFQGVPQKWGFARFQQRPNDMKKMIICIW